MGARVTVLAMGLILAATSVAHAQLGPRRVQPRAFPVSVTPYIGLGFRGVRANEPDAVTCPANPEECFQHRASSGPEFGAEIQVPLFSTFGLSVAGSFARPTQLVCIRDQCSERGTVTAIRGTALVLWRFKARAPIYFGLGGAVMRFDPGPVFGQSDPVTEFGVAVAIAYDIAIGERVGARVGFLNYFMSPDDAGLPATFNPAGTAYDAIITIGARILLGI